jgi:molybdopterin/thiamine biosynthesis adenylyltransferase/proteasome lid subunit RPN8/RPN11
LKFAITFTASGFDKVYNHVIRDGQEEAAFLLCGVAETPRLTNILVREVIPVPNSAFIAKSSAFLSIKPEFMMPIIKNARVSNLSIVSVHSHPFSQGSTSFSSIDDDGDDVLMPRICGRIPREPHGHIVLGRNSLDARLWKKDRYSAVPVDVVKVVGRKLQKIYPTSAPGPPASAISDTHQRQVLAIGKEAQAFIQQLIVAVVGLGGIGSQVFQQLVHLGVKRFILVDPDVVEESNSSRLVGSTTSDVESGSPKTEVMQRLAKSFDPDISTETVRDSVYTVSVARKLIEADIIFCCTDTIHSRMVVNRVAYQYLIPLVDVGLDIRASSDRITSAGGRVMVVLPDGPCLDCMGILDPQVISDEISALTGGSLPTGHYVSGQAIENPAVISLNGVVASLAATELLNLVSDLESRRVAGSYKVYRVLEGDVRLVEMKPDKHCGVCTEVLAKGDAEKLPCKVAN